MKNVNIFDIVNYFLKYMAVVMMVVAMMVVAKTAAEVVV